jgi:hypothetical protein
MMPVTSSIASRRVSRSRHNLVADCPIASPDRLDRLVISTRQLGLPGSSGRTWLAEFALSRTTSTHLCGGGWVPGAVPAKIGVQRSVRKSLLHPMCPVHCECGLPDPRGAVQRGDHHCTRGRTAALVGQQAVQLAQVLGATREVADRQRQLPGCSRSGWIGHAPSVSVSAARRLHDESRDTRMDQANRPRSADLEVAGSVG